MSSANMLRMHYTLASKLLIKILNETIPRIKLRRTALVTVWQPDAAPIAKDLGELTSSQLTIQPSTILFISLDISLDNLSRSVLSEIIWKSYSYPDGLHQLPSLPPPSGWVKNSCLLNQNFPLMNPCWLCMIIALLFKLFNCFPISLRTILQLWSLNNWKL